MKEKPNQLDPPKEKLIYEIICNASWQVIPHGGTKFTVKCRNCGVYVQSGGTPKCLNNNSKTNKNHGN